MKKKFVGLFAILAIGLLITAGAVSAFGPKGFADDEDRAALDQAIENGDYQTWKNLHEEMLTEDHFNDIRERHQERQEMMEGRDTLRTAIESGDYEAYTQAVLEIHPEATLISEDDFNTLVEIHQARIDGDMDTWQTLRDEIDFEPGMYGHGDGMFMGKGSEMGQGLGHGHGMGNGFSAE